jgi:hypothetical protein
MFSHTPRIIFVIFVLSLAAYAVPADQPPAAKDSKTAASSSTQESAKTPAQTQQPAPAGVVVFIDPATGKIRQPDASEIGTLSTPASPVVGPRAPGTLLQGPAGSVGLKLGAESLTYMVVTKAPDGKLDMDCITGDQAANARVASGTSASTRPPSTQPPSPNTKPEESSKGRAGAQDTHDVKVPR